MSRSTPEQRSLQARVAAYTLHSRVDSRAHSQPARDAFMARFDREVDPHNLLSEPERRRRAEAAKKAYFTGLALKSSCARQRGSDRPDLVPRQERYFHGEEVA